MFHIPCIVCKKGNCIKMYVKNAIRGRLRATSKISDKYNNNVKLFLKGIPFVHWNPKKVRLTCYSCCVSCIGIIVRVRYIYINIKYRPRSVCGSPKWQTNFILVLSRFNEKSCSFKAGTIVDIPLSNENTVVKSTVVYEYLYFCSRCR